MSTRSYPRDIAVGDQIMLRRADRGWYVDAGTVARGKHGRHWFRVTSIEKAEYGYDIRLDNDLGPTALDEITHQANSKLIHRKAQP